jgi:hypothetical protein
MLGKDDVSAERTSAVRCSSDSESCLSGSLRSLVLPSIEVIVNLMNKSTKTPSAASLRSKRQLICLRPHLPPWKQAWSGTKFVAKTIKDLVEVRCKFASRRTGRT